MLELRGIRVLSLSPIELTLPDGKCISIQGESGSGKSMLLRAVADLDPHDGDAALDGEACSRMPAPEWRRRVVYVPADSGWWHDAVRDHFPPEADLQALLREMDLKPDLADGPVSRLSTGERQRLALLRALGPQVRVLLLDEPTSGLDERGTRRVEAWLQRAMQAGVGVLLVTHSPEQAKRLAQRRMILRDGVLEELTA
ncbi:MAG: ABC transporter ATP-binding protein [Burkholderiaceae bacterium]